MTARQAVARAAALLVTSLVLMPACTRHHALGYRVIVLGFDGLDFGVTKDLMARGRLPKLDWKGSSHTTGTTGFDVDDSVGTVASRGAGGLVKNQHTNKCGRSRPRSRCLNSSLELSAHPRPVGWSTGIRNGLSSRRLPSAA